MGNLPQFHDCNPCRTVFLFGSLQVPMPFSFHPWILASFAEHLFLLYAKDSYKSIPNCHNFTLLFHFITSVGSRLLNMDFTRLRPDKTILFTVSISGILIFIQRYQNIERPAARGIAIHTIWLSFEAVLGLISTENKNTAMPEGTVAISERRAYRPLSKIMCMPQSSLWKAKTSTHIYNRCHGIDRAVPAMPIGVNLLKTS